MTESRHMIIPLQRLILLLNATAVTQEEDRAIVPFGTKKTVFFIEGFPKRCRGSRVVKFVRCDLLASRILNLQNYWPWKSRREVLENPGNIDTEERPVIQISHHHGVALCYQSSVSCSWNSFDVFAFVPELWSASPDRSYHSEFNYWVNV